MMSQNIAAKITNKRTRKLLSDAKRKEGCLHNVLGVKPVRSIKRRIRRVCSNILNEVTGTITFAVSVQQNIKPMEEQKLRWSIFLEIQQCTDLRLLHWFGVVGSPFVLFFWNGAEIGRTCPLKSTQNPVWHDECFEIPVESNDRSDNVLNGTLSFQVWHMGVSYVGEFLGQTAMSIESLRTETKLQVFERRLCGFKEAGPIDRYEVTRKRLTQKKIQSLDGGDIGVKLNRVRRLITTVRINRAEKFGGLMEKPNRRVEEQQSYKVHNPEPYRRRRCLNDAQQDQDLGWSDSTLMKAFALVCGYLVIGIIGFSFVFEQWTIRDSLYFSVVTFTTVGYGDVKPKSDGAKLFSCAFALAGIGIIGIALGYIGQNIVQAQMLSPIRPQRKLKQSEVGRSSSGSDLEADGNNFGDEEEDEDIVFCSSGAPHDLAINDHYIPNESRASYVMNSTVRSLLFSPPDSHPIRQSFATIFPIITMILLGSTVVGHAEGWNWIDSLYWCISTGTSVGYGDYAPTSEDMRWFSIFFVPVSVGVVSAAMGRVANVFVEQEISKTNKKLLKSELTLDDLEEMNVDGDGEVSLLEFVEFMLKSMNKVDQKLLDELHAQFFKLDADGSGALQEDDLELLAAQKLAEQREIVLKNYEKSKLPL
mmetsp:Transcript_26161/g.38971  ORF Transcript_26161/g.38971 Transcript_26161/m.38971 type:complete len:646 (-) Transcript_26161:105-2042(-)